MSEQTAEQVNAPARPPSSNAPYEDRLQVLGVDLARTHRLAKHPDYFLRLLKQLDEQEKLLRAAHRQVSQTPESKADLSGASEWLMDNFYLLEEAFQQIRQDLPASFYRKLPALTTTGSTGADSLPRTFAVAWVLVRETDSRPSFDQITRYAQAYQEVQQLTIGEIWAIPTMLRLSIIERMTQAGAAMLKLAYTPLDQFSLPKESLDPAAQFSSGFTGLRLLRMMDWKRYFETVSLVEKALIDDPAAVYSRLDFDTRDEYRKAVEQIAIEAKAEETFVAQEAVALAHESALHFGEGNSPGANHPEMHVGYYLRDRGRHPLEQRLGIRLTLQKRLLRTLAAHALLVYTGSLTLVAGLFLAGLVAYAALAGGALLQIAGAFALGALPAAAASIGIVNSLITHWVPPRNPLPKLDFQEGIPTEHRALVVIPALLSGERETTSLLRQLEQHFLGNADPNLQFALLTDYADASDPQRPEDEAYLQKAVDGILALNEKYSEQAEAPFLLLHRQRLWNPVEGVWMGWERKRGKLAELNRLLRGSRQTSFTTLIGDTSHLREVRYVITLDADTRLMQGSVKRMVATMAHPLNQAVFDPASGRVVAGYTILQPRVSVLPLSAHHTLFAQVYTGDHGVDLYSHAVSDIYQDLFAEGNYSGKGIYAVDAFERSLKGRVPENALLSHDLFEGIYGRAGLVTDVNLFEEYPSSFLAYAHRMHRWARGDWQLLPWLMPYIYDAGRGKVRNTMSPLGVWKIADNLRRSLTRIGMLAMLLAGWLWLPGGALFWTLAVLVSMALPIAVNLAFEISLGLRGKLPVAQVIQSVGRGASRWALDVVFLPYQAWRMSHAILTTLARLWITHRHMLEWTTAADVNSMLGKYPVHWAAWRSMRPGLLLVLVIVGVTIALAPMTALLAAPLLLAWLLAPEIAYRISQPAVIRKETLSPEQTRQLRGIARRTWLFFEQFIGPEDHWLPPDHFQESPRGALAHRTSPTNIGLALLSSLAAYDLGYIDQLELQVRLDNTFEAMSGLETYHGHLLNWYDTHNLHPLSPRYVSTVDSGNLAACLLALRQGCLTLRHSPVLAEQRWQGIGDTLDMLISTVRAAKLGPPADELIDELGVVRESVSEAHIADWAFHLTRLQRESWPQVEQKLAQLIESNPSALDTAQLFAMRIWSERVRYDLSGMLRTVEFLLPWQLGSAGISPDSEPWQKLVAGLPDNPNLDELGEVYDTLASRLPDPPEQDWQRALAQQIGTARERASQALDGFQQLANRAEGFYLAMDYRFLFNDQRKLFHIGYNVDSSRLDENYYDLFASEARLASLMAIAKGDVPQSHWLYLWRPFSEVGNGRALLSWSGSMFEYLMPSLLLKRYPETLIEQSNTAAVAQQIAYGRQQDKPWGISEAGFYLFDANLNYQYRAFGVPGLGLKRGLEEDLVVSPYASLLAVSLRPQAVLQNLDSLTRLGMLGLYGFYEAIDYTPARMPMGKESATIYSYMVHHQGMSLLALVNFLQDDLMPRRMHSDPRVENCELLLQEQIPMADVAQLQAQEGVWTRREVPAEAEETWNVPPRAPFPLVHVLSNGRFSTLITHQGGGYSRYLPPNSKTSEPIALTRWRADTTLDNWGCWLYLRDIETGDLWSTAYQPIGADSESEQVIFAPHQVEFQRRDHGISARTRITVAVENDAEIRRVSLTNHSRNTRSLTLTSYAEVVLTPLLVDVRHPAFGKLFVESEYLPDLKALLFHPRPRDADEKPVYLIHLLVTEKPTPGAPAYECDRARFLGRGGSARYPRGLRREGIDLAGVKESSKGAMKRATLDPIMALSQKISLKPRETQEFAFITLVAGTRQEALSLARHYQLWPRVPRTFEKASVANRQELERLEIESEQLERFQQLLSLLIYPNTARRASAEVLAANRLGQSSLWRSSISGDYPILLVQIYRQENVALASQLLSAHRYWRSRGLKIDLVLLNMHAISYEQQLQGQLHRAVTHNGGDMWLNQRGGIFMLRAAQMQAEEITLLETAARVVLDGERGTLGEQLQNLLSMPVRLPRFVSTFLGAGRSETIHPLERPKDLLFDNGVGGFSPDGKEYVIYLGPGQWTPVSWVNVLANPDFGCLVSDSGMGSTWAVNSGENRLTPWHNDPVSDPPSEIIYLRDDDTGEVWTPTPLPARDAAPYLIRHGAGYTVFEHHSQGLNQRLRVFVAPDAPVKIKQLRLQNTLGRVRRILITDYAEWVLGTSRHQMGQYIVPEFDSSSHALLAHNAYNEEFSGRVAFLAATRELHGLTTDRAEFLGLAGDYHHPAALDRTGLSAAVQPGLDPCAALQVLLWLAPGEEKEITFVLGQGADRDDARHWIQKYHDIAQVETAWQEVNSQWDERLGQITVDTPDQATNLMLNRWLLYQALACRVWARTAGYQSSGAYGFRDQLQDVMALVYAAPQVAREHILEAARHQFEAGDVLHWWHPPSGRGIRTRCSDNMLWLPFVTAYYVSVTGDRAILDEKLPFLRADPLGEHEEERYGVFPVSQQEETLYEHCRRALARGNTEGEHGLPLIGSHDWNDGLNRVGRQGRGESVWLGWFLYATQMAFADLCEKIGQADAAEQYRQQARKLQQSIEKAAWGEQWYLRAFYDDGSPLGSPANRECRIDSIAQSWGALSQAADPERSRQAMKSVEELLVNWDAELVQLFTPPFDQGRQNPGYIKGYPPGIRENGGQYTHAAIWAVWAFAELGQAELAGKLFQLLNPIEHSSTPEKLAIYRVEPYVVAADIYSQPPYVGRGGWTWYTGSAGWMYRLGLEALLGFRLSGSELRLRPCIPPQWPGYQLAYRYGSTTYAVRVEKAAGDPGPAKITLDGRLLPDEVIHLEDDGQKHEVIVQIEG